MSETLDDPRFALVSSGRFRERLGPLGKGVAFSSKKLCFVATDPAFLIELLYGLSLRKDCFYVKYGMIPREGMYLGRCLLETDQAVSELCQELKGHARLMVSLQDDAWFNSFREAPVPNGSCGVWDDWPEHESEIGTLLKSALESSEDARSVEAIRAARSSTISLIAQTPPRDRGREPWPIVGYTLLSRVTIDGNPEPRGLGLATLAVAPPNRRRGFGTRLVEAALRRARLLGYVYVIASGDSQFYSRFGVVPSSRFGLSLQEQRAEQDLLALELVPGALSAVTGVVRYGTPFAARA